MNGPTLVVNADDFGWSVAVNRGIEEAHRGGIVTSASLMANGEAFADAVERAARCPELGIGVHLNLLRGRAQAPAAELPTLVDAAGRFRRSPGGLALAVWTGRVPPTELEREMAAQIERVQAAGIRPTHLDSEKNIHGLPGFAAVILRLAERYGIPAVRRVTFERPGLRDLGRAGFYRMVGLTTATSLGLGRRLAGRERILAGQTVGMSMAGHLNAEVLCMLLRRLPPRPCELMVHPGYVDGASRATTRRYGGHNYIDAHREAELRALVDPTVREACRRSGVRLAHFGALA